VFEGELTDAQIEKVKADLGKIISDETDSILIYIARDEKWLKREYLGKEMTTTDNLL
jgi:CRISPR-associated protein Cas2